jgi:hypothetical protein
MYIILRDTSDYTKIDYMFGSEKDFENSALCDTAEDFLSAKELNYYLSLK